MDRQVKSQNPDYDCKECLMYRTAYCYRCYVREYDNAMSAPTEWLHQAQTTIKNRGSLSAFSRLIRDAAETGNAIPINAVIEHNKAVFEAISEEENGKT